MSLPKDSHILRQSLEPRVWIFQANPEKYRIKASLSIEVEELWNLNQYSEDIQPDDIVLIWISGRDAGIYARGTVLSPPETVVDSLKGQQYWTNPKDGRKPKPRVRVRYDETYLNRPLRKTFIQTDPRFAQLAIIKSSRGTNFPVTPEEWSTIKDWLDI